MGQVAIGGGCGARHLGLKAAEFGGNGMKWQFWPGLVLACGVVLASWPAGAAATLRVGNDAPASMGYCALNIGIERGVFRKHGLEIEASDLFGAAKAQEAMVSNNIDILLGSGSEMRFIAKGVPELAVAVVVGPPSLVTLVVRADSPIRQPADMKGHTLAITTAGSLSDWLAHELVRREHFAAGDVKLAAMGSNPAEVAALQSGQVDGAIVETSIAYTLEERGQARVLLQFAKLLPDFISLTIFAHTPLIAQHPDQLRDFLAAWFEAEDVMRQDKAAVVACAVERAGVSAPIAGRVYDSSIGDLSHDGRFSPEGVRLLSQSFVDLGQLPSLPDPATLFTEAFLPKH
jgi:NitT/TauT family transport system substrate-binding protein